MDKVWEKNIYVVVFQKKPRIFYVYSVTSISGIFSSLRYIFSKYEGLFKRNISAC